MQSLVGDSTSDRVVRVRRSESLVGTGFASGGRTFHEAVDGGNLYVLEDEHGRVVGEFPAALTVEAAVACAVRRRWVGDGQAVRVFRHLPGSRIGATMVEEVESIRVEVTP